MDAFREDFLYGSIRVDAAGTAQFSTGGIPDTGVTRTAVGVYEITLAPGADGNENTIMGGLIGTAINSSVAIEIVSDTLIRVRTSTGAAAADLDFYVEIKRWRTEDA